MILFAIPVGQLTVSDDCRLARSPTSFLVIGGLSVGVVFVHLSLLLGGMYLAWTCGDPAEAARSSGPSQSP